MIATAEIDVSDEKNQDKEGKNGFDDERTYKECLIEGEVGGDEGDIGHR